MLGRHSLNHSPALEALKWATIFALACALVLHFARRLGGNEPPLLPDEVKATAIPLEQVGTTHPAELQFKHSNLERFCNTLELHKQGQPEDALRAWESFDVSVDLLEWKLIAMASASTQLMQLDEATDFLRAALDLNSENPVAHYQLALLYLAKSATVDDNEPPQFLLVTTERQESPLESRFLLRRAAAVELEKALMLLSRMDLDAPLLVDSDSDTEDLRAKSPTVREFANAIGIENFKGSAYGLLGTLAIENGQMQDAESNLDLAATLGVDVQQAYEGIAEHYENEGDYPSAARLYLKSAARGDRLAGPISKAFESLSKAW